ncbi:MAG: geranyl transferase [Armatimonadetes bacterium CG07_land_8_20_14_0_80_40_9]|nr:MAG: geranyl transferase [Armatimonadetes bacterium CG07_land_8_20_14_0_80_40_9]
MELCDGVDIKRYLREKRSLIEKALDESLPKTKEYPSLIHQAMRYSLFSKGKRLRPILALASAEVVGGKIKPVLPVACALELIHTWSLIHDDLPSMDNDDYRRGRLTSHKVFGEGIAVLAGDALLIQAFRLLSDLKSREDRNLKLILRVIKEISEAIGSRGLIGGQTIDLNSEGKEISLSRLKYIHSHKTGGLFRVALRSGTILSRAKKEEIASLTKYGEALGLAFQIRDDLRDKDEKSEQRKKKATYPALLGTKEAERLARLSKRKALSALKMFGERGEVLKELAESILDD